MNAAINNLRYLLFLLQSLSDKTEAIKHKRYVAICSVSAILTGKLRRSTIAIPPIIPQCNPVDHECLKIRLYFI